jgi:hypothetical protein
MAKFVRSLFMIQARHICCAIQSILGAALAEKQEFVSSGKDIRN